MSLIIPTALEILILSKLQFKPINGSNFTYLRRILERLGFYNHLFITNLHVTEF